MSKTIATSAAAVAILGLVAMSFVSAIPAAHADMTTAQMEALITQLQAQLAALTGGTTTTTTATFTTDLTTGSTGADVTALQNWLIGKGFSIPAGATGYFGTQTVAALAAYQASVGITPAAGYFGPITRAKVNASGSMTTGGTTTTTGGLTGTGEGYLDQYTQLSEFSGETVGEGQTQDVLGASVLAQNADQSIDRVTVTVTPDSIPSGSSSTLNKYITGASIRLDGKTIGSMDVSDATKTGSGSSAVYTFRFTGLGGIVKEGNTSDLTFAVTGVSSVDSDNTTTWKADMAADSIRAVSPNGVSDTYGTDINSTWSVEKFADANNVELKVSTGDNNPDSASVAVDTTSTTNDVELLDFSLKAQGSDMNITSLPIFLTISGNAATTTDIVNKLHLKVNGQTYTEVVQANTSTVTFDNLNLDISEGDTLDFTVTGDINKLTGAFHDGDTLEADLGAPADIEGTDQSNDDLTTDEISGTAIGNAMAFYETGLGASYVSSSTSATSNTTAGTNTGTFTIKYKLTAFGGDVYVSTTATATVGSANTATTNAASYYLVDKAGTATGGGHSGVITVTQANGSVISLGGGLYKISEGSSANVTLTVTQTNATTADSGLYRASLVGIGWGTSSSVGSDTSLYTFNLDDYKTDYVSVN